MHDFATDNKPDACSPKHETLHTKHETRNPKSENPRPWHYRARKRVRDGDVSVDRFLKELSRKGEWNPETGVGDKWAPLLTDSEPSDFHNPPSQVCLPALWCLFIKFVWDLGLSRVCDVLPQLEVGWRFMLV